MKLVVSGYLLIIGCTLLWGSAAALHNRVIRSPTPITPIPLLMVYPSSIVDEETVKKFVKVAEAKLTNSRWSTTVGLLDIETCDESAIAKLNHYNRTATGVSAIIGGWCSNICDFLQKMSQNKSPFFFSFGCRRQDPIERTRYGHVVSMEYAEKQVFGAYKALLDHYNWKRVHIVGKYENFRKVNSLKLYLNKNNIAARLSAAIEGSNADSSLKKVVKDYKSETRVFILMLDNERDLLYFLNEADKQRMLNGSWVFITENFSLQNVNRYLKTLPEKDAITKKLCTKASNLTRGIISIDVYTQCDYLPEEKFKGSDEDFYANYGDIPDYNPDAYQEDNMGGGDYTLTGGGDYTLTGGNENDTGHGHGDYTLTGGGGDYTLTGGGDYMLTGGGDSSYKYVSAADFVATEDLLTKIYNSPKDFCMFATDLGPEAAPLSSSGVPMKMSSGKWTQEEIEKEKSQQCYYDDFFSTNPMDPNRFIVTAYNAIEIIWHLISNITNGPYYPFHGDEAIPTAVGTIQFDGEDRKIVPSSLSNLTKIVINAHKEDNERCIWAVYDTENNELLFGETRRACNMTWPGNPKKVPTGEPYCGWDNRHCTPRVRRFMSSERHLFADNKRIVANDMNAKMSGFTEEARNADNFKASSNSRNDIY